MNTSFAKETNYYFVHGSDRLKRIPFYIQESNVPSITYSTIDVPNKIRSLNLTGGAIEFDELSIKFIVDEFWQNYLGLFDELMSYKNQETGEITPHPVQCTLFVTSNKGTPFLKFNFYDCIITNIGEQPFNDASMDDEQLSSTFTIKYSNLDYDIINQSLIDESTQENDDLLPLTFDISTSKN